MDMHSKDNDRGKESVGYYTDNITLHSNYTGIKIKLENNNPP